MKIDLVLSNAKVYDLTDKPGVAAKIDILKGESFSLITDATSKVLFLSTPDAVLDMLEKDTTCDAVAKVVGAAVIQIQNAQFITQRIISINVLESIEKADKLNTTGEVVPKVP